MSISTHLCLILNGVSSLYGCVLVCSGCSNKYHRTDIYFSQFWKMRSPRSRHLQICCMVRADFLVLQWLSSHCNLLWQRRRGISLGSLLQEHESCLLGTHPRDLIAPQRPHLLISSHACSRFQHLNFEGT